MSSSTISPVSPSSRVITPRRGRESSLASTSSKHTKSCRRFVMSRDLKTSSENFSFGLGSLPSGPWRKSLIKTTIALRFNILFTFSRAAAMFVPRFLGSKKRMSRMTRKMCWRPFRGGIMCSTSSVNRARPTLSLLRAAENAKVLAISAASSRFERFELPNCPLAERSTTSIIVSSRSSRYFFTWAFPVRAVTFQSMLLISSPAWYSRASSKSMPRPLNMLW